MRKQPRDVESVYSRRQFVAKLRRLADALETGGAFTIQLAGERITVPRSAAFNVEHERGEDGEEIEFQLKWPGAAAVNLEAKRQDAKSPRARRG